MRIKVLHFYKSSYPEDLGGIPKFIDSLCRNSSDYPIDNIVLCLNTKPKKGSIRGRGYKVFQAKENINIFSTSFSIEAIFLFLKLVKKIDLIHYQFPYPFSDLLHLIFRIQKPSIVTYHSDIVKQKHLMPLYKFIMNRFLYSVNSIIATSPNYTKSSKVLFRHKKKVKVIPIGIDNNLVDTLDSEITRKYRLRFNFKYFLFVGALRYYKGLFSLLKAVKKTNINIIIAGTGALESDLKSYAKTNKLSNVIFLGSISEREKASLLNNCYGFVFPSHLRSEAFGIALLEASLFSKPLISCEIGTGTSYINIHNKTGIVAKPNKPKEIRKAMEFLLENPEIAKKMGVNARRRVDKKFSSEKQAKSYYEIYKKLLN